MKRPSTRHYCEKDFGCDLLFLGIFIDQKRTQKIIQDRICNIWTPPSHPFSYKTQGQVISL